MHLSSIGVIWLGVMVITRLISIGVMDCCSIHVTMLASGKTFSVRPRNCRFIIV